MKKLVAIILITFSNLGFANTLDCYDSHNGFFLKSKIQDELNLKDFTYGRIGSSGVIVMGSGRSLRAKQDNRYISESSAQWFDFVRKDNFCKVTLVIPNNFSSQSYGTRFNINVLCGNYTDKLVCEIK